MANNVEEQIGHRVDAAFHWMGLFVRAGVYAFVGSIAVHFDCGRAVLTGLLVGDFAGHLVSLAWQWRIGIANAVAELALLGLICLWARAQLVWPEELPLRAILGLCAFGVFASRIGGSLLTQPGPSERGFA